MKAYKNYRNKEWLYEQVVTNRLRAQDIAEVVGCSERTIYGWMRKFKIPTHNQKWKDVDLINKKFHHLTVVKSTTHRIRNGKMYTCECDCGNTVDVLVGQLVSGGKKSCGCATIGKNSTPIIRRYRNGAKRRDLVWDLSNAQAVVLLAGNCHYCDTAPAKTEDKARGEPFIHSGIDRKNPHRGYTLDNCVTCCTRCNYAKSKMTYEDFLQFIKQVYTWRILEKSK